MQLEVAASLGVYDSLVSDYRRGIEHELRALSFTEVEEARMFELALRERVRTLVAIGDEQSVAIYVALHRKLEIAIHTEEAQGPALLLVLTVACVPTQTGSH